MQVNNPLQVPSASESVQGVTTYANDSECLAGTEAEKAVVPTGLQAKAASDAEAAAMALATKFLTPDNLDSIFARSHSTNGYQKLPGGLTIQWGTTSVVTTSFPTAFTSACYAVVYNLNWNSASAAAAQYYAVTSKNTSNFTVGAAASGLSSSAFWIAIGK